MTTVQQTLNGPLPPPPCSAANIDPLLNEDYAKALTPAPEPPRCRFLSSDKRQCRMLRADHHPDFCLFHAARQEEIFALLPEREFDLAPELVALAADLTTATGVNRALGEVFRLLAKKHITRNDAVAFGYIAQLLLQTVPGVRNEAISAFGHKVWQENLKVRLGPEGSAAKSYPPAANVYPPPKGYSQDALLAEDKGELRGDHKVELSPLNKVLPSSPTPQPDPPVAESAAPICARAASAVSPSAPPRSVKPENPVQVATTANASAASAFSRPNSTIRPGLSSRPAAKVYQQDELSPLNKVNGSEGALRDAQAPPDCASLLSRSVDLLDGKFDASPESQREARRLLHDLEQITPPRVTTVECALPQTQSQPAQNAHLQNEHPDRMFVPSEQREPRDPSGACVAQLP